MLEWIVLSAARLSLMEMKLDKQWSSGSLSSPKWPLTTYIILENHPISLCFCVSLFVCLSGMASFNMIKVESDYLLICVCNSRVPHWSSQSSQPEPLGAALIWAIKIIAIIKETVYILSMDCFKKSGSQIRNLF